MRRRLTELVVVLFLVSFATFMLSALLPGDPAVTILGPHHTPAQYQQVRHELRLDEPLLERYGHWLSGAVRGDFGRSLLPPRVSVSSLIWSGLPVSAELTVLAYLFAVALSIPLALWSVHKLDGAVDRAISAVSFANLSMPEFLGALLLILVFVVHLGYAPRLGWVGLTSPQGIGENLRHAILPAFALSVPYTALLTQILRNDLAMTLQEDYILMAKAKGLAPARVLVTQALRPSLFSFVTVAGVSIGYLIGGTAVVESIFGLPGIGSVLVRAAGGSDVPVLQAVVLVLATIYVLLNAGLDLVYRYLDPRVRHGVG